MIPVVLPIPQQAMTWLSDREGMPRNLFRLKWSDMLLSGLLSKDYVRLQDDLVFTTEAGARYREDHFNRRAGLQ